MKRIFLAAILSAAAASSASALDCGSAYRPDEQTICDSGELRQMDRQLNILYRDARRQVGNPARLIARQRAWVSDRSNCGRSESCLRRAYLRRIGELQRLAY